MAFTPSQALYDCTVFGGATNTQRRQCESDKANQLRTEEYLKHYFENGDTNSYLAPLNGSLTTLNSSVGTVNTNLLASNSLVGDFQSAFDLFWVLFQVLFLGLVIVYVGKWFWRLISP